MAIKSTICYILEQLNNLLAYLKHDGLCCPACCSIFHDKDMSKHPDNYWTCPNCFTIMCKSCRKFFDIPNEIDKINKNKSD